MIGIYLSSEYWESHYCYVAAEFIEVGCVSASITGREEGVAAGEEGGGSVEFRVASLDILGRGYIEEEMHYCLCSVSNFSTSDHHFAGACASTLPLLPPVLVLLNLPELQKA